MSILELEDNLFDLWKKHLSNRMPIDDVQTLFCPDGLHYSGRPIIDDHGNWQIERDGREEHKWNSSRFKCLFLTKDHNMQDDGEGVDIRYETGLVNPKDKSIIRPNMKVYYQFYARYFILLRGILELDDNSNAIFFKDSMENAEFFWKSPVARINLKKIAGNSSCPNDLVDEYITNDLSFIQQQMNIYKANIIICCNGSGWNPDSPNSNPMMSMLKTIYPDLIWYKGDPERFLYYSNDSKVIVLHEWHMSYRIKYSQYFLGAVALSKFLQEYPYFI